MLKLPRASLPDRAIIYQGPSELDGSPIMAVLTGLRRGSRNRKTGDMVQVWIIRSDVNPVEASERSIDDAICGDCPHRWSLGGGCYVNIAHAPLSTYRAIQRGNYSDWTSAIPANALAGRYVRFGAYGDPSAIPERVWRRLRAKLDDDKPRFTGYTRQWKQPRFKYLRNFLMASVISESETKEAEALGFRGFRIRGEDEPLLENEVGCPAAPENGERVQCADCRLCSGQSHPASKHVGIIVHGNRKDRVFA